MDDSRLQARHRPFRPARLGFAVAVAALAGALATARADDAPSRPVHPDRAAEARYQEMVAASDLGAPDWLLIADWCWMVSADVSERSRDVFRHRGEEAEDCAARIARQHLAELFATATRSLPASADLARCAAISDGAEHDARQYLEGILPSFRNTARREQLLAALDEDRERLQSLLAPLRRRDAEERLRQGWIPLDGDWIRADEPHGRFAGTQLASEVFERPDRFAGRAVCTEIASSLREFALLDHTYLDGFDDHGKYLPPDFMPDRLVIALPAAIEQPLEAFRDQRARPAGAGESGLLRARVVADIARATRQFTSFYEARVLHLSILDEHGKLLATFESPRGADFDAEDSSSGDAHGRR